MEKYKTNITLFHKLYECCGCGACIAICPKDAINIVLIKDYFYPSINNEKCVNCKMCLKICSFKKN